MLEKPRFAFLFEGQGQPYAGMYADLYKESSQARAVFDHADSLARKANLPFIISESCFEEDEEKNILVGEGYNPVALQLALLTGQIATTRYLHANGVPLADINGGHSLGQMAAGVESGFMRFDTAFHLTTGRAKFMSTMAHTRDAMVCVISDARRQAEGEADNLRTIVTGTLATFGEEVQRTRITVENTSKQLVATGPIDELDRVKQYLGEKYNGLKIRYMPNIPISHHDVLMRDAQQEFSNLVNSVRHEFFENAHVPQMADVKNEVMRWIGQFTDLLKTHLVKDVIWTATLARLELLEIPLAVQIGPGNIFVNMMKVDHPEIEVLTTHNLSAMNNVIERYRK